VGADEYWLRFLCFRERGAGEMADKEMAVKCKRELALIKKEKKHSKTTKANKHSKSNHIPRDVIIIDAASKERTME